MHSQLSLFFLTLLARFALAQTTTDIGFLYPASYIGGDDSSREVWQLGDSKLISWNVPNNSSSFRISLVQSLDGTDDGSPAQVMQLYDSDTTSQSALWTVTTGSLPLEASPIFYFNLYWDKNIYASLSTNDFTISSASSGGATTSAPSTTIRSSTIAGTQTTTTSSPSASVKSDAGFSSSLTNVTKVSMAVGIISAVLFSVLA